MARRIEVTWTGADGSEWDLTAWDSPAQLVSADFPALPAFSQQFASTPAHDGRRYEGTNWQEATCILTVSVGDVVAPEGFQHRRKGGDWRILDGEFRHSLSPSERGVLTVRDLDTDTTRYLRLRLDKPVTIPSAMDPAIIGEATYSLIMTADDNPWWEGDPVPAEFTAGGGTGPFFGGPTGDTLFYISRTDRMASATITNPGDREAWPIWWARGPFLTATVGIEGKTVDLPFSRAKDEMVYVDSYNQTIEDEAGNSLWELMGFTDPVFAPIAPGDTVSLATSMTGSTEDSAIGVTIVPLHEGPW